MWQSFSENINAYLVEPTKKLLGTSKTYIVEPIKKLFNSGIPSLSNRFGANFLLMLLITVLSNHFPLSSNTLQNVINTLGGGSAALGWITTITLELVLSVTLSVTGFVISNKFFKTTGSIVNNRLKDWLNSAHDYMRRSIGTGWDIGIILLLANSRAWIAQPEQILKIYSSIGWLGSLGIIASAALIPGFAITGIHTLLCRRDFTLRRAANGGALVAAVITSLLFLAIPPANITTLILILSVIAIPLTHLLGGASVFAVSKTISTANNLATRNETINHLEQTLRPAYEQIARLLGNQYLQKSVPTIIEAAMTLLAGNRLGLVIGEMGFVDDPMQIESVYAEYKELSWVIMLLVLFVYVVDKTHLGFGDPQPGTRTVTSADTEGILTTNAGDPDFSDDEEDLEAALLNGGGNNYGTSNPDNIPPPPQ